MTPEIRALINRQHDLEDESRALGIDRYRRARPMPWRDTAAGAVEEAELPPGRQLLKLAVEPTAEALREFITRIEEGGSGRRPESVKLLSLIDPEVAAYLTARVVVNGAALNASVQATAFEVADALIDHIEMTNLRRANAKGYKGLVKKQQKRGYSSKKRRAVKDIMATEGATLSVGQGVRLQAGMKLIELLNDTTGLFTYHTEPGPKGSRSTIRPTEAARDWIERQHARSEIMEPLSLPMIVRPRRWRSPSSGGYLTRRPGGDRLVKQWSKPYQQELRHVEMDAVYAAINGVQEVRWRINRPILDVMRQVWDGGGNLGGLPRREDLPLPGLPVDFEENEEAAQRWKQEAAQVHQTNAQNLSKRLAISQRLWVATKFKDEEAIYFPHELDFRGRIYPTAVSGPHPQGDDAAKALLEFADGVPLGENGPGWLAVHLANLWGIDKVPFEERVDWVMQHNELILDSARNPLDGERFWTKADSPYSALAAAFEWLGYVEQGPAFVSRVPVALDGSNSGLQHFSAMLRDPVGAKAVNLIPADRPQDIYSDVTKRAQIMADASGDPDAAPWAGDKVTRKIAKRPCMTYCYSATRFGMQGMVLQTLREIDNETAAAGKPPHLEGADNYTSAMWMSHALWDSISDVVSAAAKAMEWLRTAAKIASEAGQPIWWTTPAGLPVLQAYRTVHAKRLDVHFGGRRLKLTLRVEGDTIDKRGQANGIAPNFVHSLDAAHLMAVVNEARRRGINALALIHDSFGSHAAHAGDLSMILRETFVAQYEPDVLARFRDQLVEQLPPELAAQLPELPEKGELDLNVLLDSDYMFA